MTCGHLYLDCAPHMVSSLQPLSLSLSFHVPLPVTFTPVLLLTWIPGPASRTVQFLDKPSARVTGPGQHAEHIQMNFYRQVWLPSTVEQNSGTSVFCSVTPALTQSPLSPILEKGRCSWPQSNLITMPTGCSHLLRPARCRKLQLHFLSFPAWL